MEEVKTQSVLNTDLKKTLKEFKNAVSGCPQTCEQCDGEQCQCKCKKVVHQPDGLMEAKTISPRLVMPDGRQLLY